MSEGKHGPLPWRLVRYETAIDPENGQNGINVVNATGRTVCDNEPYYPAAVCEADAELIVRAVNSHDELVQTLENLIADINRAVDEDWLTENCEGFPHFYAATKLLAKAKGTTP